MMPESPIVSFFRRLSQGCVVGTIAGVEIALHWSLVLIFPLAVMGATTPAGLALGEGGYLVIVDSILRAILIFVLLFSSVLLHEFGHCLGAWWIGGRAERIILWPLGGLAVLKDAHRSPYNEFIVTLAGPLVSLALAVGATLARWILPDGVTETTIGLFLHDALIQISYVNWCLFFFNMLVPLFPMDCARLIRSALSMRFNAERVTYDLCRVGMGVAALLLLFSFARQGMGRDSAIPIMLTLAAFFGGWHCWIEIQSVRDHLVYSDPYAGREQFEGLWAWTSWPFVRRVKAAHVRRPAPSRITASSLGGVSGASKAPANSASHDDLESLKAQLETAVRSEDFVRAAQLRDRLRELESRLSKRA
jgi:Zn-dependent protease